MFRKTYLFSLSLFLGDLLLMPLALFLALASRKSSLLAQYPEALGKFLIVYVLWAGLLWILGLYVGHAFHRPRDFITDAVIFACLAGVLSLIYFYFRPGLQFAPKTILLLHIFWFILLFIGWRYLFHRLVEAPALQKGRTLSLLESATKRVALDRVNEAWFQDRAISREQAITARFKRFADIVVGLLGLLLLAVLYPVITAAIMLDSQGPEFFVQERIGKGGKRFKVVKFRSMYLASESAWSEKNQSVITRTGKMLRRLHLDELPQAWNILKGDMSFVGPRAEWATLAETFEREIPHYRLRYLVKPGIVGWAQIHFPPSQSVAEAREKFEYDLYYIKNYSLLLDLEIILKSVKLFFW